MKPIPAKRFHDDEALMQYLRIDRSADAWQAVYGFYRQPVFAYFQEIKFPEDQVKSVLGKAFAELLENIRSQQIQKPLTLPLLDILLAYCFRLGTFNEAKEKLVAPSGYTYLAKKVLVDRLQQSHKELITKAIYQAFKEPAFKIIQSHYALQENEVEDIFQEAMLGLLARPPQDKEGKEAKLFTYFMQILRYKALDLLKEKGKGDFSAGDLEDFNQLLDHFTHDQSHKNDDFWDYINEEHNLGEKFSSNTDVELIDRLFEKISSNCRKLLHLRFIEEKKFKEIAEALQCSIDTIGQRVKRCLKHMRAEL